MNSLQDEIENDGHVNVSFFEHSSTNWVSIAGVAHVSKDKELVKKHWSTV
jgi:general stress protein 26